MITRFIARIPDPVYRVPLWSLWFPFAVADCCVDAIAEGQWRRIFTRKFWRFTGAMYVLGLDGVFANGPL